MSRFYSRRHAFVSFAHPDQLEIIAEVAQSFALDNGAFTHWKATGGVIDVPAYESWVRQWYRHPGFDWALIPDVIDGTEKQNDELVYSWPRDLPGVPVWHMHESIWRLRVLAGAFSMVAIGSSGQWPNPGTNGWWERMGQAMEAICNEDGLTQCRLHGLRMLNTEIFTRLPFASADSTNAAQNAGSARRFGMYTPMEAWQRANVIADRIEAHNSAARWVKQEQELLWDSA